MNDTFIYCDLHDGHSCPLQDKCKRWTHIKDKDYKEYMNQSARLYNVCKQTNNRLFLEDKEIVKEKEIESRDN